MWRTRSNLLDAQRSLNKQSSQEFGEKKGRKEEGGGGRKWGNSTDGSREARNRTKIIRGSHNAQRGLGERIAIPSYRNSLLIIQLGFSF